MILSCPSCGAQFRIDPEKLGTHGRTVRCSKCKHSWHATAEEEPLELSQPAAEPEPGTPGPREPEASGSEQAIDPPPRWPEAAGDYEGFEAARGRSRRPAAPQPEPRRGGAVGWLILLAVVIALAAGAWFGRDAIVARVPAAAQLYEMAGIPVNALGTSLELRDVTRSRRLVDGESRLVIEGRVVNVGERARDVPQLQVTLYDATGSAITSWTFAPEAKTLPAGGETRFRTERADPPDTARELSLTFTERAS